MPENQPIDLTTISRGFPALETPLVARDHFIDAIDELFATGSDVVLLEGVEQSGKTTLAAQFVLKHRHHAISLFLRGTSRFVYDPMYVRQELCDQIGWIVRNDHATRDTELVTEGEYNALIYLLQKRAKRTTFYVVLDGLHRIPAEHGAQPILQMLPLGDPGIKILLTTDPSTVFRLHDALSVKTYHIAGFTVEEATALLNTPGLSTRQLEEFTSACKRCPGHLAQVRRLLASGEDPATLLRDLPNKLPRLFEIEWQKRDSGDAFQELILSIAADDQRQFTSEQIGKILKRSPKDIRCAIEHLTFIKVDPDTGNVSYVSEPYRAFAEHRLSHQKPAVRSLLIDDLLQDPTGEASVLYLPRYYRDSRQFAELLKLLNASFFTAALGHCCSLSPLRQIAQIGSEAAQGTSFHEQLPGCAATESVLHGLDGLGTTSAEVEALISLGDFAGALAAAQLALLNEDRLHLLAIVAKGLRQQGTSIDSTILEQIRTLYRKIDRAALGTRATKIAADLLFCAPDLAIGLIEDAATAERDAQGLDHALAFLSVTAHAVDRFEREEKTAASHIQERIKNPQVRQFSAAAAALVAHCSPDAVLAEVGNIEDLNVRLLLLCAWAHQNRTNDAAAGVLEYALRLIVDHTEYVPNPRDARRLMLPLPSVSSIERLSAIVKRLDGLKGAFERNGPTVDYVRLQVLVAEAEIRHTAAAATDRLLDVFVTADAADDLATRAECLAHILAGITRMDPQQSLESTFSLHSETARKLNAAIQMLLDHSADHFQVCRPIIKALAIDRPDLAKHFALALNTESRRDRALAVISRALSEASDWSSRLSQVADVISEIKDRRLVDECVLHALREADGQWQNPGSIPSAFLPLVQHLDRIGDAEDHCAACCHALRVLERAGRSEDQNLRCKLLEDIAESLDAIDLGWVRVQRRFEVAASLADSHPDEARRHLDAGRALKASLQIDAPDIARALTAAVRLAISALSGLFRAPGDPTADLQRLDELIEGIPSHGEGARLWADVVIRLVIAGRSDEARRIVNEHVRVHLDRIDPRDRDYKEFVHTTVAPALYCANPVRALNEIRQLSPGQQDSALSEIACFLVTGTPLYEPCDETLSSDHAVDFDALLQVVELMKMMESDGLIFRYLERIADLVAGDKKRPRYTAEQRESLARSLNDIAATKFGNPRFIRHEGYRIAAEAHIARLTNPPAKTWEELAVRGRTITNIADRAYVLALVASATPTRELTLRNALIHEARQLVGTIPHVLDRVDRLSALAQAAIRSDRSLSQQLLREAMVQTTPLDGSDAKRARRHLIDVSHRLCPDYASDLVQVLDADPARCRERAELANHVKSLESRASRRRSESAPPPSERDDDSLKALPDHCWNALGALNAGMLAPSGIDALRDDLLGAAKLPMVRAYPILAWALANVCNKYTRTYRRAGKPDSSTAGLRAVFEAILGAAYTSFHLAGRSAHVSLEDRRRTGGILRDAQALPVGPGEREGAVKELQKWIATKVKGYIKICDPFFGPEELDVVKWVLVEKPDAKVIIFTSQKHLRSIKQPLQEAFESEWRLCQSEMVPPDTSIIVADMKPDGASPIHDRWWVTDGSAVRLGTSLNSLGISKLSELSWLSAEEAAVQEAKIDPYLQMRVREQDGRKVSYVMIKL